MLARSMPELDYVSCASSKTPPAIRRGSAEGEGVGVLLLRVLTGCNASLKKPGECRAFDLGSTACRGPHGFDRCRIASARVLRSRRIPGVIGGTGVRRLFRSGHDRARPWPCRAGCCIGIAAARWPAALLDRRLSPRRAGRWHLGSVAAGCGQQRNGLAAAREYAMFMARRPPRTGPGRAVSQPSRRPSVMAGAMDGAASAALSLHGRIALHGATRRQQGAVPRRQWRTTCERATLATGRTDSH